ncbi:MAG: toxin-antitoxin system YwqK family antitoxin [Bacteroidota bacterium]
MGQDQEKRLYTIVKFQTSLALFVLLSEAFQSCNQVEKKKFYYEDGSIKSIAEMKDGLMDGKREFYYPSGNIQSKGNYRNGKASGLIENFYENGKLKSKAYWLNGLQDGKSVAYFENGNLKFSGSFIRGKLVGVSQIFFETGKLQERKLYDSLGNVTHVTGFKPTGELEYGYVVPIVTASRNTVLQGKDVILKIKFPFKMKGKIIVKALEVDSAGVVNVEPNIFECDSCDSTFYKGNFENSGKYKIRFLFKHLNIYPLDTLNVNGVERQYEIVVTPSSRLRKS